MIYKGTRIMSKNNKIFAQDARTVMLGRPPMQNTMLQQMFYRCVSNPATPELQTDKIVANENAKHVSIQTKKISKINKLKLFFIGLNLRF